MSWFAIWVIIFFFVILWFGFGTLILTEHKCPTWWRRGLLFLGGPISFFIFSIGVGLATAIKDWVYYVYKLIRYDSRDGY